MSFLRLKSKPFKPRVDADPSLIQYHESGITPKPAPTETTYLPLRSRLDGNMFSQISYAQTHAHDEEIDRVPAVSVDRDSEFSAGHWYVVHPLSSLDVVGYSTRVLLDLKGWSSGTVPNEMFIREHAHIIDFKNKRSETLEGLGYELEKRETEGGFGDEAGYTGTWDTLDNDGESGKVSKEEDGTKEEPKTESHHTKLPLQRPKQWVEKQQKKPDCWMSTIS